MTVTVAPESAHPRIRERREQVEDQSLRSRNRKLVAAGVLVLLALLAAATTQSPLLDVDEVRVLGAVRKSPSYMRAAAEVEVGAPLVGLDLAEIEERLIALPEVSDVKATSDWGGVVTIEIAERVPAARIMAPEGTIVIASDGTVLEVSDRRYDELPAISGAMFVVAPGDQLPVELSEALQVATATPTDVATVTDQVEITVDGLYLRLVGGGSVALGDARDLDEKFEAVRTFLAQVNLQCLESLNVRAPRVPVVVRTPNCVS